jgi:hypothetical protein
MTHALRKCLPNFISQITHLACYYFRGFTRDGEVGQEFALKDLPPDSAEVIEVPVVDPRVKLYSVLSFKDRRGKTWFKDMHTQKVIHGSKVRRRIVAIRRAELKWLAQQYSPPAAMPADHAGDQAVGAAPAYLGVSSQ